MSDTTAPTTTTNVKPGIKTTEFWMSKLALALGALLAAGVFGTGTPAERIAGSAVAVLAALGYTVSRAIVKGPAIALIFALVVAPHVTACSNPPKPVAAIIDCGKADQAQLEALALQLAPLLSGASIDWGAIGAAAAKQGAEIGGCVLAELVNSYLGGNKAVSVDQSSVARATLEKFRREVAGGATFRSRGRDL